MSMPLDLAALEAYRVPETIDEYDPRDAILYALGVGAGLSAEIDETSFLYERSLQVLPTMALVLGTPGFWAMDPASGLDWLNILHGEQRLKLHRPLEAFGTLIGNTRVADVADKGAGKAAMIRTTKEVRTNSGLLVAEASEIWVVRGAGGFGGERNIEMEPLPSVPDRHPDFEIDLPTSPAQAAIYRLSGDRNPLHIDPAMARTVGFERPLLHGLATMGIIGRAVIHTACGGIAANLREIAVRFTAPVYPGETIRTHVWLADGEVHMRAHSLESGARVIDNGHAVLATG